MQNPAIKTLKAIRGIHNEPHQWQVHMGGRLPEMAQTTLLHDSLGLCCPLASSSLLPLPFCRCWCRVVLSSCLLRFLLQLPLLDMQCLLLAWHGGVRQTWCDSIDCDLFTERTSEQDQLNIYYGRSILAEELSNELDISLASPDSTWPLIMSRATAFLPHLCMDQWLQDGSYSSVVSQIDLVGIFSKDKWANVSGPVFESKQQIQNRAGEKERKMCSFLSLFLAPLHYNLSHTSYFLSFYLWHTPSVSHHVKSQ